MKVKVYDQEGNFIKETEVPSEIFDVKINSDLLHQVVASYQKNKRSPIAHTKDRGEVRGSTRKIWPQKHTGRARHGDRRAPIFRGGGVTFGPRKEKILKVKIPKKMRRKALFMALSSKLKDNEIIFLKELKVPEIKTKIFSKILETLRKKIENFKEGSVLICIPKHQKEIVLSARNIPKVEVKEAKNLNALDVLKYKYLLLPIESIKIIKETFLK